MPSKSVAGGGCSQRQKGLALLYSERSEWCLMFPSSVVHCEGLLIVHYRAIHYQRRTISVTVDHALRFGSCIHAFVDYSGPHPPSHFAAAARYSRLSRAFGPKIRILMAAEVPTLDCGQPKFS